MNKSITIASIQMFAHKEKKKNRKEIERHLNRITSLFPQINMVVFPELAITDRIDDMQMQAEEIPGPLTEYFSNLAKQHGVWLIPGTIYERLGDDVFNTAPVFTPQGELLGKYQKRYPWCPYEKTKPGTKPFTFKI